MTPEEALRTLTGTVHPQANRPEVEEAIQVLTRVLATDVPAHTVHLIELHNRLTEVEARLQMEDAEDE